MSIYLNFIYIILGFTLLIGGASFLVEGASTLARKYKMSEIAIGLTVVTFGTSAPELVVNSISSIHKESELVFGNIIGSNIFNLYMVLGALGIIRPLFLQSRTVWRELPFSLFAVIVIGILVNDEILFGKEKNILSRVDAIILLVFFILFLVYAFSTMRSEKAFVSLKVKQITNKKVIFDLIVGMIGLGLGGEIVLNQAVAISDHFQVSKTMIALVVVAPGTSFPELATSVIAAFRKRADLAIGNIIGSNIFNIFLVLSVSTFFGNLTYNYELNFDLGFFFFGTLVLFLSMFTGRKKKLARWEAFICLIFFMGYIYFLFVRK